MYRVVIIDDEPIIVQGLSLTIPWGDYGCEIVGTAGSGEEGLELVRRVKPDILFSDIAMPGMSGLQMIAALRSELPHMLITILTGYRDFDYAQTAIRLGVSRFLLKPTNLEEIKEAIHFMTGELRRDAKSTVGEEEAREEEGTLLREDSASCFIVRNAVQYIDEHYAEKLTLTELADKMYVSQWHLSKLLNRHMKKSFSDLLNEVRIQIGRAHV